ncbi:MAG TPA: hypothetical protein PL033_10685 [Candidatus Brocadiia bacterium]|nr:hypothetical protein [Candidatus Brocadiia bacterium]
MPKYHHFGVPSSKVYPKATYIAPGKVYATNPDDSPYCIEFLRFEKDSQMPKEVMTKPHVAFVVDDLKKELKGKNVLIQPFDATDKLRVAFITDGDALIELMEMKG